MAAVTADSGLSQIYIFLLYTDKQNTVFGEINSKDEQRAAIC
jgi:hypothetical protein